ncbi:MULTISPECIES: ATP-binding protein [unclassified Flavobacterium]|jgi:hypothetical protein|nr:MULTISPECIES: ATP-binding protein [unclassified Flavobacterium]
MLGTTNSVRIIELVNPPIITHAILDWIIHSAIRFELKGESMRKKMKKQ